MEKVKAANEPIWKPAPSRVAQSNMTAFIQHLEKHRGFTFPNYHDLYDWSVNQSADCWGALWEYANIIHSKAYDSVLNGNDIRTAQWFDGARLNFAENLLRCREDKPAIIYRNESGDRISLSYPDLYKQVARLAHALRKHGIRQGDRVAALITNRPEAIIGMLATASIGAIWSSCSPDFGFEGVMDRFGQIQPKVLITIDGYQYNGKTFALKHTTERLCEAIPSLERVVIIPQVGLPEKPNSSKITSWTDFLDNHAKDIDFEQLPFDHPLYIMYSSGTTGQPKCMVHGAGGTLLQHYKELVLHTDLKPTDTITYFTTCGWMMWNWLASSLLAGATLFLYDGSPAHPDLNTLFQAIEEERITIFGTSPKFLSSCESAGIQPKGSFNLSSLRTILSTGAPLSEENYDYVYRMIKKDVLLASISGGTDIISCFMLGNPLLPVYKGELQCRGLGMKVETYNDQGQPVTDEVGELVCTAPFPSRPIAFWDDDDGEKYRKAYFDHYPGVWRHGDYVKITERGTCIVYGRSDATLNPGGVRIGTAEIYGPVEALPEVEDSIVVGRKRNNDTDVVLFVVLKDGFKLDESLKEKIRKTLRQARTPRHVPAGIHQVKTIPRTLSGKKVELAVSRILHGQAATNTDALANPEALEAFQAFR